MQATALHINTFGLDGLALTPVAIPEPGPREVLVDLHFGSLNYRDLMVALGTYNPKLALPRVLGSDAAGIVAACGSDVNRFKPGDRVTSLFFQDWLAGPIEASTLKSALGGTIDGVFTTSHIFAESGLILAPSHLSLQEAATLPCAALTAWNALVETGGLCAGQTVLILGTGGVSLFALQIAKMHGATAIVTSSSDEKLDRVRAMGADYTINYRRHEDWDAEVFRITGRRGVDHVVEVGGAGTLPRSLKSAAIGGQVHVIGVLAGKGVGVDPTLILGKSLRVNGIYVGSRAMFQAMNAAFEANVLHPVGEEVFPLTKARDAFTHMQAGQHFGKIIIDLRA